MTVELDADERALHEYQIKHFSEMLPFILRYMIFYGALAGALLSLIFYFWSYGDTIQPAGILIVLHNPLPAWPEVLINCAVRTPVGALVGCLIAAGLGFIYAKIIQKTCRKQISTDYVEQYDLKLLFVVMQIVLPIPLIILILVIETPVLWYADLERVVWFIAISYVAVCIVLSAVRYRFLKWYIPPLLPPLE